jgi:hypothetical protein
MIQIVPERDWNASQESMKVRPTTDCYSSPGMHLSGLYTKKTSSIYWRQVKQYTRLAT